MSSVTNVILCWQGDGDGMIDRVNEWMNQDEIVSQGEGLITLDPCSSYIGGTKCFEGKIAIGAFNYLDKRLLIRHVARIDWKYPDTVQMMMKAQNEDVFTVYTGIANFK